MSDGFLDSRAGLAGKVALVIGGGGGTGAEITLALSRAGVGVAFCDIDAEAMAKTLRNVQHNGGKGLSFRTDVRNADELDAFYDSVSNEFESIDIVVNVAGGVKVSRLMDKSQDEIDTDIRLNYGYIIQSVRRAIPLIRQGGRGGSIINFTTIEAHRGAAGFAVYAGAKAATTNFTRAMAVELGSEGIRLNCVAPDTTPSATSFNALPQRTAKDFASLQPGIREKGIAMYVPLGRRPTTDDVTNAVLFLSSDLARSVTGTILHVDGGTMASSGFYYWPEDDIFLPTVPGNTLKKLFA